MQQTRSILLATATLVLGGGIGGFSSTASACNLEPSIGSVCAFAFDWCPRGYILADGRQLEVSQYQALFSLIGYRYGGDNTTMFAVPDLRGRAVYGTGQGPLLNSTVKIAQQIGQQSLMLSSTQVPLVPHTHTAVFVPTGGGTKEVKVPAVASTLEVTAAPTNLTATTTGTLKLLSPNTGVGTPAAGLVLGKGGAQASIYTASTAADMAIGGTQTFTGPVIGTITTAVKGSPGNPELKFDVPTGITGGTVNVATAGQPATMPVSTQSPGLGLTYCIAAQGLYPERP